MMFTNNWKISIDLLVLLVRAHSLPLEQPYALPCHHATYVFAKHGSQKDNVDVPWKIFSLLSRRTIYLPWHAWYPFVFHTDKSPYVGKSFIIHNKAAYNWKKLLVRESYLHTPKVHNCLSSFLNQRSKVNINFPTRRFWTGSEQCHEKSWLFHAFLGWKIVRN